jgi:GNAT superfamily N-acetyltransferase
MSDLKLRYLSSSDTNLLKLFCSNLSITCFPDRDERESFENIYDTLKRYEIGDYGGNEYHILTLLENGKIIGGAICDYFVTSNSGLIESFFLDSRHRGKGLSRILLGDIQSTLRKDAERRGNILAGIFGGAEIPFLVVGKVMNPWDRLTILCKLGFSKVRFNYIQPSLVSSKQPVKHLMLIFRPEFPKDDEIESKVLYNFVKDYFKWTMRIQEPERELISLRLKESLLKSNAFPLESLSVYCGIDDDTYYFKEPMDKLDPDIRDSLNIYRESFVHPEFTIPTDLFGELIEKKSRGVLDYKYHFLILKKKNNHEVVGFSEFFTLSSAGFGGYVAIKGNYRGKKIFRRIIRKIERAMFEDSVISHLRIRGWFGEFEKPGKTSDPFARDRLRIMLKEGFLPLKLIYDQPALPGATFTERIVSDKLFLAYKPFGDSLNYEMGIEDFLNFIRDLLRCCYYIDNPETHATFISINKQIEGLSIIPFEESLLKEIS